MPKVSSKSLFYDIDLSDYTFYIQYCPDENVENYIGDYDNGNISSIMIRGISTLLRKHRVGISGNKFCGWTAYRVEVDMWYYESPDSSVCDWYKEGYEPEGYSKYIYEDEQNVKQTVHAGEHVQMYALWDEFYIQYNANGAAIKDTAIKMQELGKYQSGNTNPISRYTSSNVTDGQILTFDGYYLYRREIDKWYYKSADGSTHGWYKKGNQPSGYTLYIKTFPIVGSAYLGGTAHPGEHLVLYAKWS